MLPRRTRGKVAEEFWDTVNGGYLDVNMVRAARAEESERAEKTDFFTAVSRSAATQKPITLKWGLTPTWATT